MDVIKNQFDRIQQQLAGLSASQKMLVACLVVIIVMTVGWWGRYAAVPDMEAVTNQPLSPEELSAVKQRLRAGGIPFRMTSEGLVEVPADRHTEAMGDLAFTLPRSSKLDFQALVKDMNPFAPPSTTDAQFAHYSQARLAEVISKFPGVSAAEVIVDNTDKPRIGGGGARPVATVSIWMKPGEAAGQKLVDAAGYCVAHSHASLAWDRVKVIVDGQLRRVQDPDAAAGAGGTDREVAERAEHDLEERVRQQFSYITGLMVSVSVRMTAESVQERSRTYDPAGVIVKPIEESERTSESSTPTPAPLAEPGAMPNTGMTLTTPAPAAGPATTTETESKTKNQVLAGERVREVKTPAGVVTPVAAAVHVPRRYVAEAIKRDNNDGKEPTGAAIAERFNAMTDMIRKTVKAATNVPTEQDVVVSMYTETAPAAPGGAPAAAGFSTATVASIAGTHSREILLGGLAVVSLFMVSMMVRRGTPLPAVAAGVSMPSMPMPVLDASEALAGEVGEGKTMLDAMELDDDAVRAQQMLDQVSSMVDENPDAAAGLVKRWLNRS